MNHLNLLVTNNLFYITVAFGIIFIILLFMIISVKMDLSNMQRRYNQMMGDVEGYDLENMLGKNADDVKRVIQDVKDMDSEISAIKNLLEKAITRVAIVRYDAFTDISSDLSFSIALLDENKSGIIISSLNGRDAACTYAKPIENGVSAQYKLSKEEEQVLREAASFRR